MAEVESEDIEVAEDTGPEIGDDLVSGGHFSPPTDDETQEETETSNTTKPVESGEFDPLTADWVRGDVPTEYRPVQQLVRSFQSRADQASSEADKTRASLNQALQEAEASRNRYETLITNADGNGVSQNGQPQNLLSSFGYAPGQDGWEEASTVLGIAQAVVGPVHAELEDLKKENAILREQFGTVQTSHASAETAEAQRELDEVSDKYDQSTLEAHWHEALSLRGQRNGRTGKTHSLVTAMDLITGAAARESADLKATGKQSKSAAKKRARPVPSVTDIEGGDGADLVSELQKHGFE